MTEILQTLEMLKVLGYNQKDIAEYMGISKGGFSQLITRAKSGDRKSFVSLKGVVTLFLFEKCYGLTSEELEIIIETKLKLKALRKVS